MKTRSSSGVGQKVDLEFNMETLRITDLNEDEHESSFNQQKTTSNNVYEALKRTSTVTTTTDPETGEILDIDPNQGSPMNKLKLPKTIGGNIRNILAGLSSEKD